MYPLQLQDSNMLVTLLVGVVLVGGIIVVLLFAFRKTSAMSNQLSKEAEARLKALRPQTQRPSLEESTQEIERPQPKVGRPEPARNNLITSVELQEIRRRLDQLALTMTSLKENVALIRRDVEETKARMHGLETRVNTNSQELQRLRTGAEQLNLKTLSLTKDIARQREEYGALSAMVKSAQQEAYNKTRTQPESLLVSQAPATPTAPEKPRGTSTTSQETRKPGFFGSIFSRNRPACANCGRQLRANDIFCDSCGKPISLPQQNA